MLWFEFELIDDALGLRALTRPSCSIDFSDSCSSSMICGSSSSMFCSKYFTNVLRSISWSIIAKLLVFWKEAQINVGKRMSFSRLSKKYVNGRLQSFLMIQFSPR